MTAKACLAYKLNHTVRIFGTAKIAGVAQDLTGRAIEVVLRNGKQRLLATVALRSGLGNYQWDVTHNNLVQLAAHSVGARVATTINIYNADNTLFMTGSAAFEVVD